jgi:hypothetical protein
VSFLSDLFFGRSGSGLAATVAGAAPLGTGIISPWQDSSPLAKIAYSEIFGSATDVVDRNTALMVPPVARGVDLITGYVSDLPIEVGRFENGAFVAIDRQPSWLRNSSSNVTPWHRMAKTLEDIVIEGWSLWAVQRTETGTILDAVRVPFTSWSFDEQSPTGVKIKEQPVTDPKSVILFQGPNDGLLRRASESIRAWRYMEQAITGRLRNPIPAMVLHETSENGVTQDEAEAYVKAFAANRTNPDGSVGFLPANLNLEVHGEVSADLFIEARNAARVDFANFLNLPASLLDGSQATASLTYVTQEGQRASFIDLLELWIAPIEARLSMGDVCPRGQIYRFNRSNLTNVPNDSHGPSTVEEQPQEVVADGT